MFDLQSIPFVPGLKLCRLFHDEVVGPLMRQRFPDTGYAAGRLGEGSDVIGFDTPLSRDHAWGPQLTIFLDESDYLDHKHAILEMFTRKLPLSFMGYPTNYQPHEDGTMGLMPITGMNLPFVSYGGSSLLANFLALGLLINVARHRHLLLTRKPFEFTEEEY